MTTPASPPISMEHVRAELGTTYPLSLDSAAVRGLAGVASGPISLLQLLNRSAAAPVNPLTLASVYRAYVGSTARSVWISFYPSGDVQSYSHGNVLAQDTSWYMPDPTPDIGNTHWIRATLQSGVLPSGGAMGLWVQLNATRTWTYTASSGSGFSVRQGVLLFQIATDSSGSNIVSSGSMLLHVEREI